MTANLHNTIPRGRNRFTGRLCYKCRDIIDSTGRCFCSCSILRGHTHCDCEACDEDRAAATRGRLVLFDVFKEFSAVAAIFISAIAIWVATA